MRLPFQLDRYTLVEPIGAGAFGRVYRAEVRGDMGFVSDLAVKVLDGNVVATNPNVARQMADEARILSRLDHPNIVKVIDFKHLDHRVLGDVFFMVLEFVRGVDTATILEHLELDERPMPATAVLHLGLMVADALVHAHEFRGRDGRALAVVHRDLKPQNLMVNTRGQVKVLDFGIAKAKDKRLAQRTQEGQTKGTVFYMSPEQLAGEDLDGRSDIYSLATILFELLLGRRLLDVEVNTPADLARAMHEAFELDTESRLAVLRERLESGANGELSPEAVDGWIALLRAALHKDPRYRPDSARVFSEQLEWLRTRHLPGDRNYWANVVAEVVEAKESESVESVPAVPSLDSLRREDSGAMAVLGSSTQEFFGMDKSAASPLDDEDSGPRHAPVEVPVTRQMAVVSGAVRTFGQAGVQSIGPLREVLKGIDVSDGSGERIIESDTSETAGPSAEKTPTVETAAVKAKRQATGASRLAEGARGIRSRDDLAARAKEDAHREARTAPRAAAVAAAPRRKKPAPGPDKRLIVGVAVLLLALVVALWAVVASKRVVAPDTDPVAEADRGDAILEAETEPSAEAAAPDEAPTPAPGTEPVPGPDPARTGPTAGAAGTASEAPPSDGRPSPEAAARSEEAPTPAPAPRSTDPEPAPAPDTRTAESNPQPTPPPQASSGAPAPFTLGAAPTATTGTLHLTAKPPCAIEIDGRQVGSTDDTRRGVALVPGAYLVRFVCDHPLCEELPRKGARKTIEVEAGKRSRFHADFFELNGKDPAKKSK